MKRMLSVVALSMLVPVAAAAQVPPVPPAPPPAPQAAPAPRPPRPPVASDYFDRFALDEAVRAAREVQRIDTDAIRETARQASTQARQAVEAARLNMPDIHDLRVHLDDFRWEGRNLFDHDLGSGGAQTAESSAYNTGMNAIQERQYDRAITYFDRAIAQRGTRTDGALHWKAFAQFRLGKWDDAQATLGQLRKEFPSSRYLADAKNLEADARRRAGQSLSAEQIANLDDDEIKVLAIQGMTRSDPERAVQLAEGLLTATNSLQVKKHALFTLALSEQPRAREILLNYAKGGGNPDLQRAAISHLASSRQKTTGADLQAIYNSTQDTDIRQAIIQGFVNSGNKPALTAIVSGKEPIQIRRAALSGLANSSLVSPQDLWALYQKEVDKDLRLQMVRAFGSMGAVDQLMQVVKTEKEPDVRREAIRRLGSQRTERTGQSLVDMYGSETDKDNRKSIISALSSQNNAEALVAIARKETTLELKTEIVRKLAEMAPRSKVAADYLMEVGKQ